MNQQKYRGFTLIELLVVIAIIGILASIVFVSLNSARRKSSNSRIQVELAQIRTQIEQNYSGGSYNDITGTGSANHETILSGAQPGTNSITIAACDIGQTNGFPATVTGDLVLTCNGVAGSRTGVVIYSSQNGTFMPDFGIYATTSPGGYTCVDSFGNTRTMPTGSIPAYTSIASPTTALCQ